MKTSPLTSSPDGCPASVRDGACVLTTALSWTWGAGDPTCSAGALNCLPSPGNHPPPGFIKTYFDVLTSSESLTHIHGVF